MQEGIGVSVSTTIWHACQWKRSVRDMQAVWPVCGDWTLWPYRSCFNVGRLDAYNRTVVSADVLPDVANMRLVLGQRSFKDRCLSGSNLAHCRPSIAFGEEILADGSEWQLTEKRYSHFVP